MANNVRSASYRLLPERPALSSRRRSARKVLKGCALALAVALASAPALGADKKNVLILNSYHQGYEWTDDIVSAAGEVLSRKIPRLEIYVEYMDTKRVVDAEHLEMFRKIMALRYARVKFDAIIASDDNALQFLLAHHKELFPLAPVVFCGVNDFREPMLAGRALFTGLAEVLDIKPTIDVALRLQPDTRRVVVISDGTPTGLGQRRAVAEVAPTYPHLKFQYLNGEDLTTQELLAKLQALPTDSIVLITVWLRDKEGVYVPYAEGYPLISRSSPVPVYGLADLWLGRGILGGKLNSGRIQGRLAASIALRIMLGGERPADMPVHTESPNVYMFDHRQLERFGIVESALPANSTVINRPFSFYRTYRMLVWTVAGVIALLGVIVFVLSVNIVQRRRAEARLRALFEGMPDAAFVHDRAGRILYCNELACARLGYSHDELAVMRMQDIDSQEFAHGFAERSASQLAEETFSCEGVHIARDGRPMPVDIRSSPIDYQGRKVVLSVARDITDRKRAEEALRRSEEEYRQLVDNLHEGIWALDSGGRTTFVNPRMAEMLGCKPKQMMGRELLSFVDEACADACRKVLQCDGKARQQHDLELRRRDGTSLHVAVTVSPIPDGRGGLDGVLASVMDVTDRKRVEAERRKLEQQIQHAQKLESLGVLAGGIAHDFNNLLVAVLGNADLALEDLPASSPARASVEEVRHAAIRASELTGQMLAYSGKGKFIVQAVDLNALVREMVDLLRVTISKKVTLEFQLAESLAPIEADAGQIRQIVMNLITNASEAIGDRPGVVTIATGIIEADREYLAQTYLNDNLPQGPYVYLDVTDTGCGMDTATRRRLFDPFFSTKFTGRGLGLAAVLGIVRGHRGAIKVDSEPGKGTTFRVLLPRGARPAERVEEAPVPVCQADGDGAVLIVDDEESVRAVAAMMLTRHGYEVMKAADGHEAVEVFRRHAERISAVVLDMTMPRMSGEETFRELRRIRRDVRVILCSGYDEQDAISRFAGQDRPAFLHKPFKLNTLLRKLQEVLAKRR